MANLNQKREFWLQHIDAWQHSGLSRSNYIKTHELSASAFSYYFRCHYLKQSIIHPENTALIPVDVVDKVSKNQRHDPCMTLTTPQGYRIELVSGFDADMLQQLLRVVEAA